MMREITRAYLAGKDYAKNGANTINCNFAIFSSPKSTKEWEKGRDANLSDNPKDI